MQSAIKREVKRKCCSEEYFCCPDLKETNRLGLFYFRKTTIFGVFVIILCSLSTLDTGDYNRITVFSPIYSFHVML